MNLKEYIKKSKTDKNLYQRLSSGECQSLLDEAIEKIEEQDKLIDALVYWPRINSYAIDAEEYYAYREDKE